MHRRQRRLLVHLHVLVELQAGWLAGDAHRVALDAAVLGLGLVHQVVDILFWLLDLTVGDISRRILSQLLGCDASLLLELFVDSVFFLELLLKFLNFLLHLLELVLG